MAVNVALVTGYGTAAHLVGEPEGGILPTVHSAHSAGACRPADIADARGASISCRRTRWPEILETGMIMSAADSIGEMSTSYRPAIATGAVPVSSMPVRPMAIVVRR
jgi:hypothetical protein